MDFFRVIQLAEADAAERERFHRMFAEIVHTSQSHSTPKSLTVRLTGPNQINVFEV